MVRVSRSIEIEARPEDIWPYFEDPEKELAWRGPEVAELEVIGEGPLEVGTRYRGTTFMMGITDHYVNEIVEVNPPRRIAWEHVETSGMMAGDGYYQLEPTGDGRTRFEITLEYHPMNFMGRLSQPLMPFLAGPVLQRFAERLKQASENR